MVYLFTFTLLVVVARLAGPHHSHKDLDLQLREAEYEHRRAVYGDPD